MIGGVEDTSPDPDPVVDAFVGIVGEGDVAAPGSKAPAASGARHGSPTDDDAILGMGGRWEETASGMMPAQASGVEQERPGDLEYLERHQQAEGSSRRRPEGSSMGAGYLVLAARELTGLSQRRLAQRVGTTQPSLAKIESGSRIPTVRSLIRVASAAGYELVLGLIGADEDPPLPDELEPFALVGVLRPNPEDDLADFVVFREPGVFDGPKDS